MVRITKLESLLEISDYHVLYHLVIRDVTNSFGPHLAGRLYSVRKSEDHSNECEVELVQSGLTPHAIDQTFGITVAYNGNVPNQNQMRVALYQKMVKVYLLVSVLWVGWLRNCVTLKWDNWYVLIIMQSYKYRFSSLV